MPSPNLKQIADWNGASGQSWLTHQKRFDTMLAAHAKALMLAAAPQAGETVLDIGCGAGATSLAMANAVGSAGRVVGIDISQALLQRARVRAGEAGLPADFLWADAGRHPFPPRTFDLLVSRLGVMFFDEPVSAFAHLREALRPAGRLLFLAWRSAAENEGASLPMGAALRTLPPPAPASPDAPGPFSFGDRERVARLLRDAGFIRIEIAPLDAALRFGRGNTPDEALDDAVQMAFHLGPLRRLLDDKPEQVRQAVCRDVREAFASRLTRDGVVLSSAAWLVSARPGY
jgi:SAM-dependent methyltransferase